MAGTILIPPLNRLKLPATRTPNHRIRLRQMIFGYRSRSDIKPVRDLSNTQKTLHGITCK